MSYQDQIRGMQNRMKVKVYKPQDNLDDRSSLCGSPVQSDDEGNQFFIIPASQADYQSKLHPHYIFGEAFLDESTPVPERKKGRPAKVSDEG